MLRTYVRARRSSHFEATRAKAVYICISPDRVERHAVRIRGRRDRETRRPCWGFRLTQAGPPATAVVGPGRQNRPARVRGVGRRGGRAAPHWGRAESRSGARCYHGRRAGSGKGCGCNQFRGVPGPGHRRPCLSGREPGNRKSEGKRNRPRLEVWGGPCWVAKATGYRVVGPILGFSRVRARMEPAAV